MTAKPRAGIVAERPVIPIVLGIAIAAVGAWAALTLLFGVIKLPRTQTGLSLGLVGGPWLLYSGLRRGPVLVIETARGTRKLGLGDVTPAALETFVAAAATAGLAVERAALRTR